MVALAGAEAASWSIGSGVVVLGSSEDWIATAECVLVGKDGGIACRFRKQVNHQDHLESKARHNQLLHHTLRRSESRVRREVTRVK